MKLPIPDYAEMSIKELLAEMRASYRQIEDETKGHMPDCTCLGCVAKQYYRSTMRKYAKRLRKVVPVFAMLLAVACGGCSLIRVNGKAIADLARRMPAPIVQGPAPERIIDWPELLALAGMGLGGIAHRYYFHRIKKNGLKP